MEIFTQEFKDYMNNIAESLCNVFRILSKACYKKTMIRCDCGSDYHYSVLLNQYNCFDCGRIKEIN